ncbi:CAP domain-containing protein [Chloroflexota bacterium]
MTTIMKIIILSMLSIIILLSMLNCAPSISQEEYNSMMSELSDTKNQVTTLKDKLAEAAAIEGQYQDLNIEYEELRKQHDARIDEIQTIKSELDELNTAYEQLKEQDDARITDIQAIQAKYDELNEGFEVLKGQYNSIIQDTVFSVEEIDQAIYELINQERKNSGVDELEWGKNLYTWAKENSREMAEKGQYKYSDWASWQEILVTSGHKTLDDIANGALNIWKTNDYRYRYHIINTQSKYGAVATYKLGEIYYITYMASNFR